jgi:N-acyl-D-amino-acid deacylase
VTTEVIGNCSYSAYPVRDGDLPALQATVAHLGTADVDWGWNDLDGYRQRFNARGAALNVVPLAGHAALRVAAMGYAQRPPTADELASMQRLLAETMEQGAFGLSVGLTVVPSRYADTDELVALCQVAARYGGYYATHQREDPRRQLEARKETLDIARRTGIPVQMAHNNIFGEPFWYLVPEMLATLERARASGVDVSYDVYPYLAGMATIDEVLPGWAQEGGVAALVARLRDPPTRRRIYEELAPGRAGTVWPWDWTQIRVTSVEPPEDKPFEGQTVAEVAAQLGVDGLEALLTLAERDRATATFHALSEANTRALLQHPLGMVGSDGNAVTIGTRSLRGRPHPRFYGTFPRLLGRYVREGEALSLTEAIRKITSAPAARVGLHDRGLLAPATVADIVVFDPREIVDQATFEEPNQYATGVDTVLVSGQLVLHHGVLTGALPGRALARAG